jgi:Pyruvate/2-oxoacid:ferredoxin oxidoreductase gamma subunit
MAGAFARVTGLVGLDSLCAAIRESAPSSADANVAAARDAWDRVDMAQERSRRLGANLP